MTILLMYTACDPVEDYEQKQSGSPERPQDRPAGQQEQTTGPAEGVKPVKPVYAQSRGKQIIDPFSNMRVVIQKNPGAKPTTVTVYSNKKRIHSYQNHQFRRLYAYRFRGTGYVFIEMWEGGAHCCFPTSVYSVTGKDVRFLKTFELGHAYFDPDRDLLIRSGNLHYRMKDDRFAYFRVSFAASIFYDRYFKITPGGIQEVNARFRDKYLEQANQYRKRLLHQIRTVEEQETSSSIEDPPSDWIPPLLGYTVNQLMAGNRKRAWNGYDRLYRKIKKSHPVWVQDVDPEVLKNDIRQEMKEDSDRVVD